MDFSGVYALSPRGKWVWPCDICHLAEMRIVIRGQPNWLRRTEDQDGYVFDKILRIRLNTVAGWLLLTRLLKPQRISSGGMTTDKLKFYGTATRKFGLAIGITRKGV